MPITERAFWARKPVEARFETVVFTHPEFTAPFRLVRNEFAAVTLGGHAYTPVSMDIKPPKAGPNELPRLVVSFARQQVGRQFKAQLRRIRAAASRAPIAVTYAVWLQDTDAPKRSITLYASDQGGVSFDSATVQVSATLDQLSRVSRAPIYDPAVFSGLELV
jgi:hypothetical protein